jgi:hypothetical protein
MDRPVSNSGMRWFLAVVVILVFFALDRAYMNGRNAELLLSTARRGAVVVNNWAADLTRSLRR